MNDCVGSRQAPEAFSKWSTQMNRNRICAIALLVFATPVFGQDYRYAIFEIPWLGGDASFAQGICADGSATGGTQDELSRGHVVVWMNGAISEDRNDGTIRGD